MHKATIRCILGWIELILILLVLLCSTAPLQALATGNTTPQYVEVGGAVTHSFAVMISNPTPLQSYVSLDGSDSNSCALTAPCRTWQAALAQTQPGGEILTLDSGGFGLLNITQAVTLVVPQGVYGGMSPPVDRNGVVINAPGARVVLKGITVSGQGGNIGVDILAAGEVVIEGATIENMAAGIVANSGGALRISGSRIRLNSGSGIALEPNSGTLVAQFRGDSVSFNGADGITVANGVVLDVKGSDLVSNTGWGINATGSTSTTGPVAAIGVDAQANAMIFNLSGGLSIADNSGATPLTSSVTAYMDHNDVVGGRVCVSLAGAATLVLAHNTLSTCDTGVMTSSANAQAAIGNTYSVSPASNTIDNNEFQTNIGILFNSPLPTIGPK